MRLIRAGWFGLQAVGSAAAVIAVLWLAAQAVFHVQLLNVQTGSMRPVFVPGDALVMQRIDPQAMRPGMVVSYHSLRNPNELVTHRVVRLTAEGFQTRGDAVSALDPPARGSLLAGRVVAVLPGLGRPLGWLTTLPGLIVCVYLPAVAITLSELRRLERYYQFRRYVLNRGQKRLMFAKLSVPTGISGIMVP